ncbi:ubiquinol-cytochrome C chaperone family protein [Pinisolibacter aquiterrae]|uniref:ubiquinol-cytochrome C chaperone family protein n=1 Tax=Pinisolibacter aquiterrae TaxID=2815579 RepID=UPI001C3CEF96|nr:ubiquinol-cytochrome C chaperone family protein [Pinisolibacter aquiterrae]MBV5264126.1 ubiquinol-cytochrome C chaperone [Pinisolibacter aquiterrae]MCC8233780.1 ubiquinol-cytochrome C chaperone [Pinisolibacter aquiterrae]
MIFGLFDRGFADTTFDLYRSIVAEARRPIFYVEHAVPDTVTARFDMIVLMMAVVLHRLRAEPFPPAGVKVVTGWRATDPHELGRQLLDLFFTEMDQSLREMGIGDVAVPKRIKKLASAWNGRVQAYDAALAADDADTFAQAIARNVFAGVEDRSGAAALARHALAAEAVLAATPLADVLAGRISWPDPSTTLSRIPS